MRLYRTRGGEWDEPDVDACAFTRRRNYADSAKVRPPSLFFSSLYTQRIIIYTALDYDSSVSSLLEIPQHTTCVFPASPH
jgi:hypothetical protein